MAGRLARLGRTLPAHAARLYFEWKYRNADPWGYAASEYEIRKYEHTLVAVASEPVRAALEVGCSEGVFTRMLAGIAASRVLGIDISARAVARARRRCSGLSNVEIRRMNALDGSLPGPFDLTLCCEVLSFYPRASRQELARQLTGSLERGGRVILVHQTPRAERLHAAFVERPELVVNSQTDYPDSERPYRITTLARSA